MSQRSTNQTMSGATIAVSASLPATYDSAGYGATAMVYTTIGQVEDFGEHGANATIVEFTPVADGIVQKLKGSKNYGTKKLMIGNIPGDSGQVIIDAAVESTARYSVKITYPTGVGESTPEIHYMDVLVASRVWQDGAVNSVRKCAVDLAICRKPVVVAAT